MLSPSFTALLLIVMLPALTASPPAASGAFASKTGWDGTWHAELIPYSGQAGYCPGDYNQLVADLIVIFRRDADSIPYPPLLFSFNNGLFLGSARVSAAGYSHGWTWTGVCLPPNQISAFCDCSVSHTPATPNDSNFTLYMACSVSYPSGSVYQSVSACLGAYTFSPVNASSID
jgi:hypothetical protein